MVITGHMVSPSLDAIFIIMIVLAVVTTLSEMWGSLTIGDKREALSCASNGVMAIVVMSVMNFIISSLATLIN